LLSFSWSTPLIPSLLKVYVRLLLPHELFLLFVLFFPFPSVRRFVTSKPTLSVSLLYSPSPPVGDFYFSPVPSKAPPRSISNSDQSPRPAWVPRRFLAHNNLSRPNGNPPPHHPLLYQICRRFPPLPLLGPYVSWLLASLLSRPFPLILTPSSLPRVMVLTFGPC